MNSGLCFEGRGGAGGGDADMLVGRFIYEIV